MAWLSQKKIDEMGFAFVGNNVLISEKASFHNCAQIKLGHNVRIDDFCVLSAGKGGISIRNHVLVSVHAILIGDGAIEISDFCSISSRVAIYSSNDDYSGLVMTGPTLPSKYISVNKAPVFLDKHVIVGSGSVILPGVTLALGVSIGALSLVKKSCKPFGIYGGNPLKFIKERKQDLLQLEIDYLQSKEVGV